MPKNILITFFWMALALCVILFSFRVYWELLEDRPTDEYIWKFGNHVWYDMRWRNIKEWKYEDHVKPVEPKPIIKAQNKPVEQRKDEKPTNDTFDLDRFAVAVSHAETGWCTKWAAISHLNCFWLMQWDKQWRRSLKKFKSHEESFIAFKKLWKEKYGNKFPTMYAVKKYTWDDRSANWYRIVSSYYYK